ncbi:hypothetical protein B0H17DRAFT_1140997 [Mycena rosella]|uniref:Uncharacterized protein n=1 Tax=Mycena rosella TaxID=1033263 RepID=A0AAD7D256_MYCRO|nr:hypothetical protein B0H17DRAFT_1140997 [Mycena rosella]
MFYGGLGKAHTGGCAVHECALAALREPGMGCTEDLRNDLTETGHSFLRMSRKEDGEGKGRKLCESLTFRPGHVRQIRKFACLVCSNTVNGKLELSHSNTVRGSIHWPLCSQHGYPSVPCLPEPLSPLLLPSRSSMAAFSFHLPDFDAPPNDATQPNASSDAYPPNFDAEPLFTMPDYDTAVPPPPTNAAIGSFEYNLQHNYQLCWASWDVMRAWMKAEQRDKSIEFLRKESPPCHSSITAWDTTTVYICARQDTSGD